MTAALPPIGELLPHTPPSLLLDELVQLTADGAVARVRVTEQSLFRESQGVPAIVALEYMAQTIAAFSGARRRDLGLPAQLGLLVGCRRMTLEVEHFRSGDELLVEARHVGSSATLGQFDCAVSCAGTVVARGVLSVYEGPLDRTPP